MLCFTRENYEDFFVLLFLTQSSVSLTPQTCDYVGQLQPDLKRVFVSSGSVIYHLLFSSAASWFLYQKREWTVIARAPFPSVFPTRNICVQTAVSRETRMPKNCQNEVRLLISYALKFDRDLFGLNVAWTEPAKGFEQPLHGMQWTAAFRSQGCRSWTVYFWQDDIKLQLCQSNSYYSLLKWTA